MEGSYWLRVVAIAAMVLGALYVLAPTVVQFVDGPEDAAAEQAGSVQTTARRAPEMEVVFTAADPARAEAAAQVLQQRLAVAEIPTTSVSAEEGRVTVDFAPGASSERIAELATAPGQVQLYAPQGMVPPEVAPAPDQPIEDPTQAPWWPALVGAAGQTAPEGAAQLTADLGGVKRADGELRLDLDTGAQGLPNPVVVAIDGLVRGVAVRTQAEGDFAWRFYPLLPAEQVADRGAWPAEVALLTGPLPTPLGRVEAAAPAAAAPTAAVQARESTVPAWLRGILPDTPMALGLDLQGGIDLTLDIDLEEAVIAQVGRDAAFVPDAAEEDGLAIERARADHALPLMRIRSTASPEDLQAFMARRFQGYDYAGTEPAEGTPVHLFQMEEEEQVAVQENATDQVLETLRKRVDATGVKEPSIVKKGTGRINIQLPGMVDLDQAVEALGTTAVLEFRLVDEEFPDDELERILLQARQQLPADQYDDDETLNRWLHQQGLLAEDRLVMWEYEVREGQSVRIRAIPLKDEVILTGNDINNASVSWDQNQQPYVGIEFKSRGSQIFCEVTGANEKKRFAIILDDEIRSAPQIRERICGGRASIEMGSALNALDEAKTLALVLRTGSLNAPVNIASVTTVGSTLGQDAIRAGALATVVGSVLVFAFLVTWYRKSGLVAIFSLCVNVLLVLSVLALFGATLTLPGIAGIALTIGMAVDANIIIYERIREELRLGVNARKAVDAGFEKAFVAIMDANVTTAIAGIVLFSYGTGPIRGFAVTLTVGIVTTLISALFVSRTLMELLTRRSAARLSI